ncbi:hypothetical protein Sbal183_2130 [Shewanella baltica OS183]|nr:hypothetical protein Sbal175_2174 [Shewanella baltica BA175]EHQ15032.1 hypothetical protein Sbal183_2130 [Shewanella baltica OS183]
MSSLYFQAYFLFLFIQSVNFYALKVKLGEKFVGIICS